MKKLLSIATMVVAANFGLLISTSAQAAQFSNGGGVPYGGSQCMDVAGGGTAPLTPVHVWNCHGWKNQQWTMQGFTIFGIGSTGGAQTCLDVFNANTAAGTTVNLYPCNGTVAQQWYFYNGKLYNPNSGRCLDAGNQANGTRLTIQNCANVSRQQWQIK
jgi:Ricin-type beta-trefoil lectin domain